MRKHSKKLIFALLLMSFLLPIFSMAVIAEAEEDELTDLFTILIKFCKNLFILSNL